MPDLTVPEAAVDAVLSAYPPAKYPDIAANVHGILDAAGQCIGAVHLRQAAKTIRDLYPADVFPDPTGPNDPPERHAGAMARAIARQLDTMARQTEAGRG